MLHPNTHNLWHNVTTSFFQGVYDSQSQSQNLKSWLSRVHWIAQRAPKMLSSLRSEYVLKHSHKKSHLPDSTLFPLCLYCWPRRLEWDRWALRISSWYSGWEPMGLSPRPVAPPSRSKTSSSSCHRYRSPRRRLRDACGRDEVFYRPAWPPAEHSPYPVSRGV